MASKKILIQVDITTKAAEANVNKVINNLKGVEDATVNVSKATKKLKTDTGLNNAILLETGRLASDASFGFGAMANNLGQLVTLFQSSAAASGGLFKAITRLFRIQSLFIIGIQLLISFLPKIIKNFQDKAKAARAVNDALIEGENAIRGQTTALEVQIGILNDESVSLAKKENLLKEIKKQTGLHNIELDENNKLSDDSNKLLEKKIKLMVLEAQADVLKNQMQEELTKRAKDLNDIEISKNSTTSKATDFIDRQTSGVRSAINAFKEQAIIGSKLFDIDLKRLPVIGKFFAAFEGGSKIIDKYNEDVNSQTAIESRNRKAREKSNKIINESEKRLSGLIQKFKELTLEMLGLKFELGEFNEKVKELNIITFDEFMNGQNKILELTTKFNVQLIDNDLLRKETLLNNERDYYLNLVDATIAGEEAKEKARLAIIEFYAKKQKDLKDKEDDEDRDLRNRALREIAKNLDEGAALFEEQSAANKALRVSSAVIDTYAAANTALNTFPPPFSFIAAASTIVAGLANVKKILDTKVPRESGISSGLATSPADIEAPDFNVVGASDTSQLASSLARASGRPIQAFVVGKEVTTQQELDRNITNNASIN